MIRSTLHGLLALICVGALGAAPVACQSGGVGDPCTPEAEYDSQFAGFKVGQDFIESRSFQCATRICLVNHFQGRVSCPLGQSPPKVCDNENDTSCGDGVKCVESQVLAPECDCKPNDDAECVAACGSIDNVKCDANLKMCVCSGTPSKAINGVTYSCRLVDENCKGGTCARVLKAFTCHKPNNCQSADGKENADKDCCVPGTDTPVAVPVCGQCNADSFRDANNSVYCSCRCCPKCCDEAEAGEPCEADKTICGEACDPNFNYCSCPDGFYCSKIRPKVGLGDEQLTGAYCVKEGTEFKPQGNQCGEVAGYRDLTTCAGQ